MGWKIIKTILVVVCMTAIFMFSNDSADASDEKSNGIIVSVAEFLAGHTLSPEKREEKIEQYVVWVRKGAHFSIFLLLGFLVVGLLKEFHTITWKEMFLAFVFSFIYACSDEIHQLFVPGRSGNIIDVVIDSLGSYFGILLYYGYYKIRRKLHE